MRDVGAGVWDDETHQTASVSIGCRYEKHEHGGVSGYSVLVLFLLTALDTRPGVSVLAIYLKC